VGGGNAASTLSPTPMIKPITLSVADPGIAGGGLLSRASMEGPKVPSEAREARSAEGGGVWGGAVAPPQYGGLGAKPPENFQKINVEIAYFSAFLQAEMVFCSGCKA